MHHRNLLGTSEAASKKKKMLLQDLVIVRSMARTSKRVQVSPPGQGQTPVRRGGDVQPENWEKDRKEKENQKTGFPGGTSTAGVSASEPKSKGRSPDSRQPSA